MLAAGWPLHSARASVSDRFSVQVSSLGGKLEFHQRALHARIALA